MYPDTQRADDSLWEMANVIREHGINDELQERECYEKIVEEYQESIFLEESKSRLKSM